LLKAMKATGKPLMISTGMSTMDEIHRAVEALGTDNLMIAHSTSAYPCPLPELNLSMVQTLQHTFPGLPIGYSGHETGLATTLAAVVLGADFVERHFTLDRAMWGSDQAASVEPTGMRRLVKDIRNFELAAGDGVKCVYESELGALKKLRRIRSTLQVD
ncbi:MAG: N-acetylneuraminate synthase family protein, partial [Bacteroidota bacterium]